MDDRSRNSSEAQSHATAIDHTLKELQRKVREYEAQLNEVATIS
jgi:flagellar biosynthesis chaperone FliJ